LKKAKRYRVHGKVQGVGFRFFALTCAEALQLTGWVRNAVEGQVEVHAEGPDEKLAEFEFDLSRGPRFARVDRVEQEEVPVEEIDGFEVLR
jgi:acylphosphatase